MYIPLSLSVTYIFVYPKRKSLKNVIVYFQSTDNIYEIKVVIYSSINQSDNNPRLFNVTFSDPLQS